MPSSGFGRYQRRAQTGVGRRARAPENSSASRAVQRTWCRSAFKMGRRPSTEARESDPAVITHHRQVRCARSDWTPRPPASRPRPRSRRHRTWRSPVRRDPRHRRVRARTRRTGSRPAPRLCPVDGMTYRGPVPRGRLGGQSLEPETGLGQARESTADSRECLLGLESVVDHDQQVRGRASRPRRHPRP